MRWYRFAGNFVTAGQIVLFFLQRHIPSQKQAVRLSVVLRSVQLLTDLRWTLLFALVKRDKRVIVASATGVVEGYALVTVPGKVPTGQLGVTSALFHRQCTARWSVHAFYG